MILPDSNPSIEILPEHIIDQIKAGEVLERPASLLKELIENSLDAGSTVIDLHLIENGMDLLSISDNGHGMSFENLPFAFLRHATSKLKTFEDLYRLHSFGFRGEALASVAASARITCTSQPKDLNLDGGKIIISGGSTELLIPQRANAHGTSIYIKDLFFNTPARLKFIKSRVSEKSAIKKIIYSFVLSNPQVTFTIQWDDKEKEIFKSVPKEMDIERISQVFFTKKTESPDILFAIQEYENYRVKVYFTRNPYSTPQYRHHYLFVNKRFFQDKSLHQAVLRNLDIFWRFGESGHYVIMIEAPPEEIDVNVHPNKTQIKFLRSDVIYSLLVSSLKAGIKSQNTHFTTEERSQPQSPPSFFNQEDNRNFDLMNFSNDSLNSPDHSLFQQISPLNEPPRFQRLHNQFLLADIGKPVLIDLRKLLSFIMSEELQDFILNDESSGPLLISEPFKVLRGKIDHEFESLKSLGFEFDRLNAEYIVLRTIPKFLPQVLLFSLADAIIKYFELPKISNYEKNSFRKFYYDLISNETLNSIPESFIEKNILHGENGDFLVELTPERLKGLFKS